MSDGAASAAAAAGTGELAGRAVLVTGASSGIGRAIVAACGRAGAGVLAVGRDEGRLEETKQLFDAGRADDGGSCVTLSADVCADGASERIVATAIEELGGLDVVIPAAGVFAPEPFLETSLESLDRQYEVNVRAPFALLQAAMPELARRGGTAVLVSSVAGVVGFPASTGYCATKGAVELLSKALALEFAPAGVRINSVAPGNVRTSMNAHLFADPEYERQMLASTPAGRIGEPEDIASAVVFLASSRADYMHGATLLVDGGWTAG